MAKAREHVHHLVIGLIITIAFLVLIVLVVLYQTVHRPLPSFKAVQQNGQKMDLTPFTEPNLVSDTILQWATKAATTAYTFDYVNYKKQMASVRPYFTEAGWRAYVGSVNALISDVVSNQIFVYGVVSDVPVISNQGEVSGKGYVWRVQIPFLVSYESSETVRKDHYFVTLTIIRVPTYFNPQGIGIDQFLMSRGAMEG